MRRVMIFALLIIGTVTFSQQLNLGDGVRITLLNISENISGDYFIQNDGTLQMPYLEIANAQQKDFVSLKKEIESKYTSLYKSPELTVQPLFRINVLGEVNKPGLYFVTGVEKLSSLLALAGGETSDADLSDLKLLRNNEEIEIKGEEIISQGGTLEDIGLHSGDRIYVPREWWVSAKNTTFIISGLAVIVTLVSLFIKK